MVRFTQPIRFPSASHCERDSAVSQSSSPGQVASLASLTGRSRAKLARRHRGLHSTACTAVSQAKNKSAEKETRWHLRAPSVRVRLRLHPAAINSITISFAILKLQSSAALPAPRLPTVANIPVISPDSFGTLLPRRALEPQRSVPRRNANSMQQSLGHPLTEETVALP